MNSGNVLFHPQNNPQKNHGGTPRRGHHGIRARIFSALLSTILLFTLTACREVLPAAELTPAHTQEPKQAEEGVDTAAPWFSGDWVGVLCEGEGASRASFLSEVTGAGSELVLLHITASGAGGYGATLGNIVFSVSGYDSESVTLCCTEVKESALYASVSGIEENDPLTFTRESGADSTEMLSCTVSSESGSQSFLLARVSSENTKAPYWYGGYEGLTGTLSGVIYFGETETASRVYGMVLQSGEETRVLLNEEAETGAALMPRTEESEDLLYYVPVDEGFAAYWPMFLTYEIGKNAEAGILMSETTAEHKDYFEAVYLPKMQALSQTRGVGIWAEREELLALGLASYANRLVSGSLPSKYTSYVPELVTRKADYRPAVTLAGIAPGDTIDDVRARLSLFAVEQNASEPVLLSIPDVSVSEGFTLYTDGENLLVTVLDSDGRISEVTALTEKYPGPDGRRVGDDYHAESAVFHGEDAVLTIGGEGDEITGTVSRITLSIVLDRTWSTIKTDIDGDGVKEKLTLSGRTVGSETEYSTLLTKSDDTRHRLDESTITYLTVTRGKTTLYSGALPCANYGFLPSLSVSKDGSLLVSYPVSETEAVRHLLTYADGAVSAEKVK